MTTPAAMTATAPRVMWAGRRAIETGVTGTTVATEVTGATGTSVATEVNAPTGVTGAATLVAAMADDPVIVVAAVAVATATAAKDAARVATTIVATPEVDVITWIPRPNSLHAARARSAMDVHSADTSCACTYAMT
jgi:CMP-2-keto-3-deoxyoctulosonic acid synthetase